MAMESKQDAQQSEEVFVKELTEHDVITTPINSTYLLNNNISCFAVHDNKCKLMQCKSLQRLSRSLREYHQILCNLSNNNNNTQSFDFQDKFDIVSTLNDTNHLSFNHSTEFENICTVLMDQSNNKKMCDLSSCSMMKRNYRNRSIITSNEQSLHDLYFGNNGNFIQQILDNIHCYYFHTFDIGYKLTKLEKQNILNDDTKSDDDDRGIADDIIIQKLHNVIKSKRKHYQKMQGLERLCNDKNKFMMETEQNELDVFSYGYRYFYWQHYKNNNKVYDDASNLANFKYAFIDPTDANVGYTVCDWYIDKKYNNFKTELTDNAICFIGVSQWKDFVAKATVHLNTDYVNNIKCPRKASAAYYEMKECEQMKSDHLIAMMVYCGCDELQFKFSATYRRKSEKESDEQMQQRHRNYWHLGRLLRECVECFGMEKKIISIKECKTIRLYQGVNQQFVYSSMFAYIKGPLSTTQDFTVALNFSNNKGMIIDLSVDIEKWQFKGTEGEACLVRKCCMDMSWISDYKNEQEIFVIGGLYRFEFNTIISAIYAMSGKNYEVYVIGIKHVTYNMYEHCRYDAYPKSQQEMQTAYRLMMHELSRYYEDDTKYPKWKECPDYIKELLHAHCTNVRWIRFVDKSKLHKIMLGHSNGWIKIEIATRLFPNVERIIVEIKHAKLLQQPFIYDSMLAFLKEQNMNILTALKKVEILLGNIDESEELKVKEYMMKEYMSKFAEYSWNIYINTEEDIYDVLSMIEEIPKAIDNLERRVELIMESK